MIVHTPTRSVVLCFAAAAGLLSVAAAEKVARSANFRVHTTVVADDDNRLVAANLTIFFDHSIYDFPLDASQEATIFDSSLSQFTLLDGQREIQCRLARQELLRLIAAIEQRARKTSNPRIRFIANPSFQESFDPDSLRLTLAGKQLTYVVLGKKPEIPSAAGQYREFTDWFARLNAIYTARPPTARLQLNQALSKRELVPERISRHIPERETYSSKHVFGWRLEKGDLQRIDKAQEWSRRCRYVSLDQYRRRHTDTPVPTSPR